jgi:putative colanic acid biosynthesis acetyltransferase WcaF
VIIQGNDPFRGASFSLRDRAKRQLWNTCSLLAFRASPRSWHRWRAFVLRRFGARLGEGCHVYPGVRIWAPWNLQLGDHVGVGDGATLYSMDLISIGDYAVISQGAHLCGGTHDYNSENFQLMAEPIEIGARAWICAEAFVHPGVIVPEGAVVGARAVVVRSLEEPWAVYAGNPCRKVGVRQKHDPTPGSGGRSPAVSDGGAEGRG